MLSKCADSHLSDDPKPKLFRLQKHAGSYKFLSRGGGIRDRLGRKLNALLSRGPTWLNMRRYA